MHNLQLAQGQFQDQSDLEGILRKISATRLPMEQNNLAILLTCDTLLDGEYVCEFDPKKAVIGTNMRNSNVHRALRGLKERRIVISDSVGRVGINLDLDGWDVPEKGPDNPKGPKKPASRSKKSKKSGRSKGGSGKRSGANPASKNSVAKAEIIPPESDQIPEESEEILDDVNEILENLEPFADSIINSPESEEISAESTEIQGESEQIHYKTTSRNNKIFSHDRGDNTPAERGVFLNNNKNKKTPPSGGLISQSDSDNNLENNNKNPAERGDFSFKKNKKIPPSGVPVDNAESAAVPDSGVTQTKYHVGVPLLPPPPKKSSEILLLPPPPEKSDPSEVDSKKTEDFSGATIQPDHPSAVAAKTPSASCYGSKRKSCVNEPDKPEDRIPYSERPFPGSRIEEAHHERPEDS